MTSLPSRVYGPALANAKHAPNPTEDEYLDCLECGDPWPCPGVLVEVGQVCCDDPTPGLHAGQVYCESCDTTLVPERSREQAATEARRELLAKVDFESSVRTWQRHMAMAHGSRPTETCGSAKVVCAARTQTWEAAAFEVAALRHFIEEPG